MHRLRAINLRTWVVAILVSGFVCFELTSCIEAKEVRIFGTIRAKSGAVIPKVSVFILDASKASPSVVGSGISDAQGRYEAQVRGAESYIISVHPLVFEGTKQGFSYYKYILVNKKVLRKGRNPLQIDFGLEPAGNIVLKGYDSRGKLIRKKDIQRSLPAGWDWMAYVATWEESAAYGVAADVHDDYCRGKNWSEELAVPAVLIPLNEPRSVDALFWEAGGFGRVRLQADNGGRGFKISRPGDVLVLNLNYELAKTKYRKLKERYELARGRYDFSKEVVDGMGRAGNLLNEAALILSDEKKRAAAADKSLSSSLWAGEALELEKAQKDIETNRKGTVVLTVKDKAGNPVSDATVRYEQKSHDFLFGVGAVPLDAEEIDMFGRIGVNYSSFVAGWKFIEPELSKFSREGYEGLDEYFAVRKRLEKFKLKGYGPLYFAEPVPKYLKTLKPDGLTKAVRRHIYETVKRYRDKNIEIDIWNAADEPTTTNPLKLAPSQVVGLTKTSIEAIRRANPRAEIHIDDYQSAVNESFSFSLVDEKGEFEDKHKLSFYEFLKKLREANVTDYDGIELQFYPGGFIEPLGITNPLPAADLSWLSHYLDRYSEFGKPIYLDQLSAPSTYKESWKTGWWRKKWNKDVQADFLKCVYTIAFSKAYVRSVTWFDGGEKEPFIQSGGLLDKSKKPKASYFALRDLISSWTSKGLANTDKAGRASFRGFGGNYKVTVVKGNSSKTQVISVKEREDKGYTIIF